MKNRDSIRANNPVCIINNDGRYKVVIGETIGFGGSCIVYRGLLKTKLNDIVIDRQVVVKEFYPKSLDIERADNNELLVGEDEREQFTILKRAFLDGQGKHSKYYELAKDSSLPRAFIYGEANNTSYAISDPGVGSPLTEINRDNLTLSRVALLMESLCKAFGKMHHAGYLYLDCKPDNIFFSPQNIGDKVYLFDFDTIIELSAIESSCFESCSYSVGWAAPEQLPLYTNDGYSNPKQIGYHTDIFSIGAVLFWLLTGRKIIYTASELDELDRVQRNQFDWRAESSLCKHASDNVVDSINSIAKILLQPDPILRKKNVGTSISVNKVATLFGDLYGITAGDDNHFSSIHEGISVLNEEIETIGETGKQTQKELEEIKQLIKTDLEKKESTQNCSVDISIQIAAKSAYSDVWRAIDELFLQPHLLRLKPYFYERKNELPKAEDIELGIALSLRIRDGIQYAHGLLPFIPYNYRESHFAYQKKIMSAEITKLALKQYTFDWEEIEHDVLKPSDVRVDSIVAYSKHWTAIGDRFVQSREQASLRKYFFENKDELPPSEEEFEMAKAIAEMYRDAMMYSELLLDTIPFEFRRSYNKFKRNIMEAKIIKVSMDENKFLYEEELGY